MIVWVNQLVSTFFAAEDFFSTVGDHFIHIHICTGSGTALDGIHDKFISESAVNNFITCLNNGGSLGDRKLESTPIGERGSFFYFCKILNEKGMQFISGDWEIFFCAKGLNAVICIRRDLHFSD